MLTHKLPYHFLLIIFYSLVSAVIGSFLSNALLSISSILLTIAALGYYFFYSKNNIKLLSIFILSLIAFFSIIWSYNAGEAFERSIVKLPLLILILPLYIVLSCKQLNFIIYTVIFCCTFSIIASLVNYGLHYDAINNSYLKAKVMPIYFMGDHIRFSWFLVLMMFIVYNWLKKGSKTNKLIGFFFISLSFIFLHLLAAKTGLLCLYLGIVALLIYNIKKYFKTVLLVTFALVVTIFFIVKKSETLKNRFNYVKYDLGQVISGNFITGLSDGARILSWKAGIDIGNNDHFFGVGFGDVKVEVIEWHKKHHSNSQLYEVFLPTNQFIIFYAAMGFFGVLLFSLALYFILFYKTNDYVTLIFGLLLLIPLVTDDSFERQHGVFVFAFCYLLQRCVTYYFEFKVIDNQ